MKLTKKQEQELKTLTQLNGISGQENEVAQYLLKAYEKRGYPVIRDNLGSVFALKKSANPNPKKVMIAAHMDEVGFIVVKINDNGTICAHGIGGLNEQTLLATRIILKGKKGYLYGAIDATPPHLLSAENKDKVTPIKDLLFDFGFQNSQEAVEAGVYIGAMMVMEGKFASLANGQRLLSKAFDDRIGLFMGLEILDSLKDVSLPYDLYVGGTVQEEVGCRGAVTSSYAINPHLAIVVDCSPSRDSHPLSKELGKLGAGFLIRVIDGNMIAFKHLTDFQIACAQKSKAKYQYYTSPGGTDAGMIHKNLQGVPTLTHCLCARNIHTPSSIIDVGDYLHAKKALLYMLKNLPDSLLNKNNGGRQ